MEIITPKYFVWKVDRSHSHPSIRYFACNRCRVKFFPCDFDGGTAPTTSYIPTEDITTRYTEFNFDIELCFLNQMSTMMPCARIADSFYIVQFWCLTFFQTLWRMMDSSIDLISTRRESSASALSTIRYNLL